MSEHLCLAPLLESYFRRRLVKQRNATPATMASYRDALRMLILFASARLGKQPAALELEELDRDLVLAFLDELEEKRNNSVATRNARLAAIRSFFHHVAADGRARPRRRSRSRSWPAQIDRAGSRRTVATPMPPGPRSGSAQSARVL